MTVTDRQLRIGLFGPPCSGKHTVAADLARRLSLAVISTRDLITNAVQAASKPLSQSDLPGSPAHRLHTLGGLARKALASGAEVPEAVCAALVLNAIESLPTTSPGWVLADYPAKRSAVLALEKLLTG